MKEFQLKHSVDKKQIIEQVKNQIAQDIHDSLAQTLASIQMRTEVLEKNLYRYNVNQEVHDNATKIKREVWQANKEIRALIQNFRSPQIEFFHSAINDLIKKFKTDTNIKIFLQYNCEGLSLDVTIKTNIYRIIQESLANIKKHSKAQFVLVMLNLNKDVFSLIIEDDGVGFVPNLVDNSAHFGLSVMQERAAQISGKIEIESEPNEGCRISFSLKTL